MLKKFIVIMVVSIATTQIDIMASGSERPSGKFRFLSEDLPELTFKQRLELLRRRIKNLNRIENSEPTSESTIPKPDQNVTLTGRFEGLTVQQALDVLTVKLRKKREEEKRRPREAAEDVGPLIPPFPAKK